MHELPKGDELLIYFFSMMFSALSWLGKIMRTATGEEVTSGGKLLGGLIGALLLGFTVASLLITYTEAKPVIVWTASIISGVLGEQATYGIIASLIKARTGINLDVPKEEKKE